MEDIPDHAEMRVIVGFAAPLRLISVDGAETWSVTLDDVNSSAVDYVKLNRVSGGIDGNIEPFAMLVCFDGALVLPALPEFPHKQRALEVFNRVCAELLLGGEFSEGVVPNDVCPGVILPTGYVRIHSTGEGVSSRLHAALRSGEASHFDTINLLNVRPITIQKFEETILKGRAVLSMVPKLSPDLFLAGITHCLREQWAEAMVTLWTTTEQLIGHLWSEEMLHDDQDSQIPGRKSFLTDYRTWPVSTRIELLYQKGIVDRSMYANLDIARKARNSFIHDGRVPPPASVRAALQGMFSLLARSAGQHSGDVLLAEGMTMAKVGWAQQETDVAPPPIDATEIIAWRAIRHLPGELGWEGEFERFDLGFVPIDDLRKKDNGQKSHKKKT